MTEQQGDAPLGRVELAAATPSKDEFFGGYTMTIEVFNLEVFKVKLATLNRKAQRYNLLAITYRVLSENTRRDEMWGEELFYSWDIEITGTTIQVGGDWTLMGVIDHREHLVKSAPNLQVPPQYTNAEPICDHCHVLRDRFETFVVGRYTPQTGVWDYMQVGRTCLRDFMGIEPARALMQFDLVQQFSEEGEDTFRGTPTPYAFDLEVYLACVVASIKAAGWVGRASARENGYSNRATADSAFSNMITRPKPGSLSDIPRFTSADREMAKRVIEFMKNLEPKNEYLQNLRNIGENGFVTLSSIGYAASAVSSYGRIMEQEAMAAAKRLQQERTGVAPYLGVEKDKVVCHALVTSSPSFPNDYTGGTTFYHRMRTQLGQLVEWRTDREMEVGRWYEVKGTVKKCDTWQGMPETVLTRCTTTLLADEFVKERGYE